MKENIIKSVDEDSPLKGRVQPGDALLRINGKKILDVLDYKFHAYDSRLHVEIERPDGSVSGFKVKKEEGGELGLEFESYLMDRPRSCANSCIFCFIDQLPKGMRPTLYFKDDDARLSFLLGNYITLTNLSSREAERIKALRISPINISVHTTNPELRCRMLRNARAGDSLELMREFALSGIEMNCQIVCCPGINDGEELLKTMKDLAQMYPQVRSVSIVPVGLTKFREGLFELEAFTKEKAEETLELVESFAQSCFEKFGSRIFFCGDELYIKAGMELPPDEYYEGYVQLENGVGMIRLLETEFASALELSERPENEQRFSIACGASAAVYMKKLVSKAEEKYNNLKGNVFPIENDFFGHDVNVTGLITGQDLIAQLEGRELGDRLLISMSMLRREERDFLDDITLEDAEKRLGVPIAAVEQDGFDLLDAMLGLKI